jgi:hypothetical protein
VTTKVEAAPFVIAWCGFSGPAGVVQRESRMRADHPLVTQAPHYFVPEDVPKERWPTAVDQAIEEQRQQAEAAADERQRRFEEVARKNPVKLDVRLLKAKEDLYAELDGAPTLIQKGSVVTLGHWLATDRPDSFEPVKR